MEDRTTDEVSLALQDCYSEERSDEESAISQGRNCRSPSAFTQVSTFGVGNRSG